MPDTAKLYSEDLLSVENVKKFVLHNYNLEEGEICQIKFKDTEKQRAVYKVDYMNKSYCLKKVYFQAPDLLFVYSSIEWLYRNGINVPRLLPTKDKGRYIEYEKMLFILTPWIEGIKCSYDNLQHVLDSSTTLAKLHKCCSTFTPVQGSITRRGYENILIETQKHLQQLLTCSNSAFKYKDHFSKIFLQNFEVNLTLAQSASNIASSINSENLSKSLCHLDYVNKNIIFDENNELWVIDFDKCKMDYCMHDVSYFLRRLLRRDNTRWDIKIAISSLKAYEEIKPISLDDYKFLIAYLAFPQKYWKISKDYYNNINKCNKNSFITLLNKATEKNEYHLQFINGLKSYVESKFKISIE